MRVFKVVRTGGEAAAFVLDFVKAEGFMAN
jgi:hypothetical protein